MTASISNLDLLQQIKEFVLTSKNLGNCNKFWNLEFVAFYLKKRNYVKSQLKKNVTYDNFSNTFNTLLLF